MLKSFGISGRECAVELGLLSSNADIGKVVWFYGEENPDDFKVVYEGRTSVLVHSSGKKIIGAEHLSAAALAFPNCQFKLNAPQGELPLLDGSAKLWKTALENAVEADPSVCSTRFDKLHFYNFPEKEFEIKMNNRFIKYQRSDEDCLEIKYDIERFGQSFSASVKINSTKDLEKIFLARTYIFAEELPSVGLSENLRGCGIVLGTDEILFENEPAFHKILDFLGDITLYAGILPYGRFEIYNGGHEMHHRVQNQWQPLRS
ncbi:MAG: UDP-3-O-acyl-N-acetylglucosamine deacetylase [Fibromonadaceae bacterium]|jgi:UDP-3-O-[3-hydroxymyristoyl] N-acetylglucosamine deacetylase|nr:UDP-3-O-acyl-N-acetylglucosamine deacetylase [Fibromonadaceae bacterium]